MHAAMRARSRPARPITWERDAERRGAPARGPRLVEGARTTGREPGPIQPREQAEDDPSRKFADVEGEDDVAAT